MVPEVLGRAHPEPIPPPTDDLDISFLLESYGVYTELNRYPYRLSSESFQESNQVLRRMELTNPFVDGTFLASYTKDNVTESLVVWVYSNDHAELQQNIRDVTKAFEQYNFSAVYRVNRLVRSWTCLASDYSVSVQQAHLHSKMAQIRASLVRMPMETIAEWGI